MGVFEQRGMSFVSVTQDFNEVDPKGWTKNSRSLDGAAG
jgi:hypothetical protein